MLCHSPQCYYCLFVQLPEIYEIDPRAAFQSYFLGLISNFYLEQISKIMLKSLHTVPGLLNKL